MNQEQIILNNSIQLRKELKVNSYDSITLFGQIESIEVKHFDYLINLERENLIELYINKSKIYADTLNNYLEQTLDIELKIGDINNYFETIDDFINSNKFECTLSDYYIANIDYLNSHSSSEIITNYNETIKLISLLKQLKDSEILFGNNLELFFFKGNRGVKLLIDYNEESLRQLNIPDNFIESLSELGRSDKKDLFISELLNFLEKNGNSFNHLIEGWNILIDNYTKSYSLFLSGFSFEKIKTSSNEHFQKLLDKIYETIGKASNYIFGVPIGYILIINNFDFSGILIEKNFILLILSIIFLIMIWNVLFKNISESINAILVDISDFQKKIKNNPELNEVTEKLKNLQELEIPKQFRKLNIVKGLTFLIFGIIIIIYIYIFIDKSVFLA